MSSSRSVSQTVSQAEGRRGDWGGGLLVEEAGGSQTREHGPTVVASSGTTMKERKAQEHPGFPGGASGKKIRLPEQKTQEVRVRPLGREDPLE